MQFDVSKRKIKGMKGQDLTSLMREVKETIAINGRARAVFGQPVSNDGVTIIPVAKVTTMGGGGGGWSDDDPAKQDGEGGGGGLGFSTTAEPEGMIMMKDGEVKYKQNWKLKPLMWGGFLVLAAVAWKLLKTNMQQGQLEKPIFDRDDGLKQDK